MSTTAPAPGAPVSRRWIALIFIALAQLMVILDATIVNIAMPSAQRALDISDGNRQWMITAYTLAFGGLLLLGGRVGDLIGRKRTFLVGLVGFAGASALGGAAQTEGVLFAARALQGAFGALLAPAALSLLAVTFTTPKDRAKAFGIYGAIAGSGSAVGLILGGVLTEYLNWRWALYVNVPIAVIGLVGGLVFIREPASRNRSRLDVPGTVLVTAGLVSLVYGFTRAESEGWGERGVMGLFVAAGVLLVAFVAVESMSRAPLVPPRVVVDRVRGGAYLAVGLAVIGMFGLFLFMTYYLQTIKLYSPVRTGLAFLPMTVALIFGSTQISARLVNRVPPRALMAPGLLVAAGGTALLTRLEVDSPYTHLVLPAMVLLGLGLGVMFMPAMNLATSGVDPRDAGVASAMVNTSQQVGGSIGTALLNTIAATATRTYVVEHGNGLPSPQVAAAGLVHGFTVALWWAAGVLVLAALTVIGLINTRRRGRIVASPVVVPPDVGSPVTDSPVTDSPVVGSPVAMDSEVSTESVPARRLAGVGARIDPYENPENDDLDTWGFPPPPGAAMATIGGDGDGGSGTRISGYVRGGESIPIAGAALTLIDPHGHQVGRATTAGDGSYALTAPGGGTYMLIAASEGHEPQVAAVVAGDEPLFYDLTLSGGSGVEGVVRSAATGAPVASAMVVVTDVRGEVVTSARTGEDGGFSFNELVPGSFVLAVSARGHRPAALPIEVTRQGTTRHEVELQPGARVQGVVRAGRANLPLADARVTLVNATGDVVATATTGPDGLYAFVDLDPGHYTLVASGYPPVATALTLDGTDESGFGLSLGHPDEA
ncbi:MFS transporter [Actinomadura sp. HBU206391]|uniref:MFS transporter n=1 Tax=Actinomadura sp. HBU206391 TaxID=2731692 RepID=UPI00164FD0BF|nr:MFS transporter [Actinomadura sp. HBU206391]MBC6458881.1 DHA2 family efflux MFS transporter permease subunit [Actinomadura sp. HBU206391]